MSLPVSRSSSIRIGVGAGTADDRIHPAVELAEHGELDYLVFECLAERTVARENLTRRKDPEGYTPRLLERIEAVLPLCLRNGMRIVTNMGAANPRRGRPRHSPAREGIGCGGRLMCHRDWRRCQRARAQDAGTEDHGDRRAARIHSAAHGVRQRLSWRRRGAARLATGASIVITGRVADPSLFLGPAMHHYGWRYDDWPRLAAGMAAGHLLECSCAGQRRLLRRSGQEGGRRSRPLGYPFADIAADGRLSSASSTATAAASTSRPAPSSCSTKSTIRRATSRPTASSTSPTSTGAGRARPRRRAGAKGAAAHADLQGHRRLSRRLHRRRPDLVRRASMPSRGRSSAAEIVQQRLKDRGLIYSECASTLSACRACTARLPGAPGALRGAPAPRRAHRRPPSGRGGRLRGARAARERARPGRRRLRPDGPRNPRRAIACCCRASWSTPQVAWRGSA